MDVKRLKMVVASPDDVEAERDIVEKVAEELNRSIAAERGLRLEVVPWETDTDPHLPHEDYDILVGIFSKRFGKPAEDTPSGPVYEFLKACEAWKEKDHPPIKVYFNKAGFIPSSLGEIDLLRPVLAFKADEGFPKGELWWEYEGPEAFEDLVRDHLTEHLRQQPALSDQVSEEASRSEGQDQRQKSISDYEYDIFISYAPSDDQTWITTFRMLLDNQLKGLLGKSPNIASTPEPTGIDHADGAVVDTLQNTAILVPLLSPDYVKSEQYEKEFKAFLTTHHQNNGADIENQVRVFGVVKTPIPPQDRLDEIQQIMSYKFFQIGSDGQPETLTLQHSLQDYTSRIMDLVGDIKYLLNPPPPSGATVYLAETTSAFNEDRLNIWRALRQRGHKVLPDRPLLLAELGKTVRDHLEYCDLSIHLVGKRYSDEESFVFETQNKLAAEKHEDDPTFAHLIWIPADEIEDENQQGFVDKLKNDPAGAALLEDTLEDLKTFIQDTWTGIQKKRKASELRSSGDAPTLYLICDKEDREEINQLKKYLFDTEKMNVRLPLFNADEEALAQIHRDTLRLCDAVLIYYGHTNELWLNSKLNELLKVPGYGRTLPLPAAAYLSPQKEWPKSILTHMDIIKGSGPFSPEAPPPKLKSFVEAIWKKRVVITEKEEKKEEKKEEEVVPSDGSPLAEPRPVKIFVSYSHDDLEYVKEGSDVSLLDFFKGLKGVEFWWDDNLGIGDKWDEEIKKQIADTDIALVLVSHSFLTSPYCTNVEISGFLQKCEKDEGLIICPVMLSACAWEKQEWLKSRQFLPSGGETIEEHYVEKGKRKRLYLEILEDLEAHVQKKRGELA